MIPFCLLDRRTPPTAIRVFTKRVFTNATLVLLALNLSAVPSASAQNIRQSPHATAHRLALSEVQWTDGFWKDRVESCHQSMIPSMWEIMKGTDHKPFLEHFRIAAGLSEGRHRGAKWNDGDFYKWMEGVCAMLAVQPDAGWERRLDEIIDLIGRAQRHDGYLHTPTQIAARNGDPEAHSFSDRFAFEMYNMGHLLTTACVHHQVTGKDNLLRIARKTADFLSNAFQSPTQEQARHAICPSHYMGLIDLFRVTADPAHLQLAKKLIAMRDLVAASDAGGDDNQDRLPFLHQTEVAGHAVRANYLYAGIADLYSETGDPALREALERLWDNLVQKKMYLTGGCGALYDGASPDASADQEHITRIHQAYGRNYQLPNTTAHNETCANIGNVLWNWRMFLNSGESRFIDVMELALYNSVLSGVSLQGTDYFYTNPLRVTKPLPVDLRWSRQRVPFVTSYCCPPNLVRTLAQVNGYAYAKANDSLWVNLYGSNQVTTEIAGQSVTLRQISNYPWDGKIHLVITHTGPLPFTVNLRIPAWAASADLHINGQPQAITLKPGSFAEIRRTWTANDTIDLQLPMPPQLIESHPLIEETRNEIAIKRGPLVYCLESHDLPEGVSLANVRIPETITFTSSFDQSLLGGVVTLRGEATSRPSGNWEGHLYRPFSPTTRETLSLRCIPYYAWGNRGAGEMSVWLPLD